MSTFLITALILGGISSLVLLFVSPMSAIAGNKNTYNDFVYTPSSKDNLTVMTSINEGEKFVFVKFDARSGDIPVVTLPKETMVSLDGDKMQLGEIYTKRGFTSAKEAVNQTFGFEVSNLWKMNSEDFKEVFKIFGDIFVDFPMEIMTDKKTIMKGKQHINAKFTENILSVNKDYEQTEEICTAVSIIYSKLVNEKIKMILDDNIEETVMNFLDVGKNDISYYDFEARRNAIIFVAKMKENPSVFIETSGKYFDDDYILSESTKEIIIKLFDKKLAVETKEEPKED